MSFDDVAATRIPVLGAVLPPGSETAVRVGASRALWGAGGQQRSQPDWPVWPDSSTISLSWVIAVIALGHPA